MVTGLVAGNDSIGVSSNILSIIVESYPKNNKGANEVSMRRIDEMIRITFQIISFFIFILPIFIMNIIADVIMRVCIFLGGVGEG